MKKKYTKPVIEIEHYELTQSIAACSTKINFLSSECVMKDPDSTDQMKDLAYSGFFTGGNCEVFAEGMDGFDKICYHTNANATFTS